MQQFVTKRDPHEFTVDGRLYVIPAITAKDLENISTYTELGPMEQALAFRAQMIRLARRPHWWSLGNPSAAVGSLSWNQLMDLIGEWSGMGTDSGESSASDA